MTTLTPRQLEILRLHADGYTSRDIRDKLFIAENTIKTHNAAIRRRLGAHTMPQAVANAYQQGVLQPDVATVLRQLDSARAWAVELEQGNAVLSWLLAEAHYYAEQNEIAFDDLDVEAATLSTLLRGMARRVGYWRRESNHHEQDAATRAAHARASMWQEVS